MSESLTTVCSADLSPTLFSITEGHPIYSPTDTADWLRCPTFRVYRKFLAPRGQEWTPNITMGNALDSAMKVWWLDRDEDSALKAGEDRLTSEFQEGTWPLEALVKLMRRGFKVALEGHPHMPGWQVWAEGEKLIKASATGHGPKTDGALIINGKYAGTPDLITQTEGEDSLTVTDLKVAMKLKAEWTPKRMIEYDTAIQGWQYAWAVGQVYGKPVTQVRFQQISLEPMRNHVAVIQITPARLDFWLRSQMEVWKLMAQGNAFGNWTNCMGKYGRCDYLMACHDLGGDLEKIKIHYDVLEPEPEVKG